MSTAVGARRMRVQRRAFDAMVVLVRGDVEVASWTLAGHGRPGLAVIDELARLVLAARRMGCSVRLRDPGAELSELLDLAGLREVVAGPQRLCEGETDS